MTPSEARRLAVRLRQIEGELMDFGLETLGLDDAQLIALNQHWRGQIRRLAFKHAEIADALAQIVDEQ